MLRLDEFLVGALRRSVRVADEARRQLQRSILEITSPRGSWTLSFQGERRGERVRVFPGLQRRRPALVALRADHEFFEAEGFSERRSRDQQWDTQGQKDR